MPPCRCKRRRGKAALLTALSGMAALLLMSGGYLWLLGGRSPPATQGIGGPFQLTAMDGRELTNRSFRGRYVLLYFGYTSCRDVCPLTLAALDTALDSLGAKAAEVQPLFVSIDPQRDTPPVLRGYVAGFGARLIGLTGTNEQLRHMRQEYQVASIAHPTGIIDHSSVLYLLGPDGRYLAPIRADESAADMAADIARHLS